MGKGLRESIESARNAAASFFLVAWALDRLGLGAEHEMPQVDSQIPMDAHMNADITAFDGSNTVGMDAGGGTDAGPGGF